jgi:hypothetical protein
LGNTLRPLRTRLDPLAKELRRLNKTLDPLAKVLDQREKALCLKTQQRCKDCKALLLLAKPHCRMNGRDSSNNPPTNANRKTTVQPHHHHQHGRIAMVNTSKSTHHPTVALSLPKKVPALIVYAQGIAERLTGNPSFPTPAPAVAAIVAAIHDLEAAETAALARTKGSVAVRNDKRKAFIGAPLAIFIRGTSRGRSRPMNGSITEHCAMTFRGAGGGAALGLHDPRAPPRKGCK